MLVAFTDNKTGFTACSCWVKSEDAKRKMYQLKAVHSSLNYDRTWFIVGEFFEPYTKTRLEIAKE